MTDLPYCKNCNRSIDANFCSECGQKQYKRIDGRYIINSMQETIIQTNRGFFYTLKNLIINPGRTAHEYIDGNRVNHYKPLSLAFLLATISTFVSYKLFNMKETSVKMNEELYGKNSMHEQIVDFIGNYNNFIMLLGIPFVALTSYWAFKKYKHNYYEHIIIQAYYQSLIIVFSFVLISPLNLYFADQPWIVGMNTLFLYFIGFIGYLWFWKGFYPSLSLGTVLKRTALQMLYLIIFFVAIGILGVIGVIAYLAIYNPA